ncbi:EF-hand domain-containing protein [Lysobacter sp. HA18]
MPSPMASGTATVATSAPGAVADMHSPTRFSIDTAVLDANHDGYLSREEAAGNLTLNTDFATIDTNADGRIGTDELRTWISAGGLAKNSLPVHDMLSGVGSASAFQMLDVNGDGRISSKEAGAQASLKSRFRTLDTNHDGILSQSEYDAAGARKP